MDRDKLLISLRTLVKRLKILSHELKLLAVSFQNGPGLQTHQWKGILEAFIKVIDEKIYEKKLQSNWYVWLADVKVLAADVEEILDEIAENQTFEEPSKNCFPFSTRRKRKAVHTVNDGLRNKIFRISSQMATLNDIRYGIGLQASNKFVPNRRPELCKSAGLLNSGIIYGRGFTDQGNLGNFSMAGNGKRSLARLVSDGEAVEDFKPEDSDVSRISTAIMDSINYKSYDLKDLNDLAASIVAGLLYILIGEMNDKANLMGDPQGFKVETIGGGNISFNWSKEICVF